MKKIILLIITIPVVFFAYSQNDTWSEEDRKYLLENLIRSRDEILKETRNLSKKQWTFRESPERWSIADVVDHIGIWELLLQREISMALAAGPQPELASSSRGDSATLATIMEDKVHITNEYTKPFTFAQPTGLFDGEQSTALLMKRRNESIEFVRSTTENLRAFYMKKRRGNIHQLYLTTFGHMDRHLKQIRKIKAHVNYPAY